MKFVKFVKFMKFMKFVNLVKFEKFVIHLAKLLNKILFGYFKNVMPVLNFLVSSLKY